MNETSNPETPNVQHRTLNTMKKTTFLAGLTLACLGWGIVPAPGAVLEAPVHEELRMLRTNLIHAITAGDFDKTLQYVHTNVVVTWQNNEVCRGHAGLRTFFEKVGKEAFQGYVLPPTPDELTILYGDDTGVSFGRTVANYHLFGKKFQFTSRWTATLVKENGRWLLGAYHISLDALDNPLLNAAKKSLFVLGAISAVLGALLGFLVGRSARPRTR
jgi:ketosteroid isomerase-like protein